MAGSGASAAPSAISATPPQRLRATVPDSGLPRLQRRSRWGAGGTERRHGSPDHRRRYAEREEERNRQRFELRLRRHPAKVARAQVPAEVCQCERGNHVAQHDPGDGTDQPDHETFQQQHPGHFPGRGAEHAQQGEMLPAPQHGERLRREHEEPPREEGDESEHVEIHAIRAGQAGAAAHLLLGRGDVHPRRQQPFDRLPQRRQIATGRSADVDPVQGAEAIQPPLGRSDVHERRTLRERAGREQTCYLQFHLTRADLEDEHVVALEPQLLCGLRTDQDGVGIEEIEDRDFKIRHQRGLHSPGPQQVEPEHLDRFPAAGKLGVDLDRRTRRFDPRQLRDPGEYRLVEARRADRAPPGPHLQK